ncbi:MAG: glycosyltransferase family protein [Bacteroidota bacterium]|nr:glycosyltransferase family protein [Bacteroidota bacterium]
MNKIIKKICVIQARMGSQRLPGKVLKKINQKTLIETLINRIQHSKIDKLLVATTNNIEDDVLCEFLKSKNISYFRGSDWDVLDRFYNAVNDFNLNPDDLIIRICSDNPLHHYDVVNFAINQCVVNDYDYFSNSNLEPDFLEDGIDSEVFKYSTLEKAWKEAELLSEREHVCPYMKKTELFKCGWLKYNQNYNFKLSVDTKEDLLLVKKIIKKFGEDINIAELVNVLKTNPELLKINKNSIINSGYHKSLKEDKYIEK